MRWSLIVFGLVVAVAGSSMVAFAYRPAVAGNSVAIEQVPKPVDVSMHDFMEGVFQSPYRRLKAAMAAEPKDNPGWKAIRSDALILAEGGNLLLMRKPEKDVDAWDKYSVDSRDAGAEMVAAAKKKDFAATKEAYAKMLTHCNACHTQFDHGKNQLAP